jgi:rhomboid protease GluP
MSTEAVRERRFYPRPSRIAWLIAFLLLVLAAVLGLALLAAFSSPHGRADGMSAVVLIAVLLCLLGLRWALRRARAHRRPLLRLGSRGVLAAGWRAPLPWAQLKDVELVQTLGQAYLEFHLHDAAGAGPRSRWGRRAHRRRLHLTDLAPEQRLAAYAAIHARLAPLRQAAGLGAAPSVQQVHAAAAFERRLDAATPVTWGLYLMVALNVGVWLLQLAQGLSPFKPTPAELYAWGANSASAVVLQGQHWRLLTATFLHAGLLHLAFNMLGLWEAGRQICRWYGNGQFLLIYLGAALGGSALSLHFSAQQAVSVGASGAVFGVLGAVLVALWRHRERIPAPIARRLLGSQGVFIAYAFAQGLGKTGVDNAAHVGGLLMGAVLALLLAPRMGQTVPRVWPRQALAAAVLATVVGALVAATPGARVNHRLLFESQASLQALLPRLQASELALARDAQAVQARQLHVDEFMDRVRRTHLPAFQQHNRALRPLAFPDGHPLQSLLQDLRAVFGLIEQSLELELRQHELLQRIGALPFDPGSAEWAEWQALRRDLADNGSRLRAARARLQATVQAMPQNTARR